MLASYGDPNLYVAIQGGVTRMMRCGAVMRKLTNITIRITSESKVLSRGQIVLSDDT